MYYFIVNPNSGSGRGLWVWKRLARYLDRCKIEYEMFLTEREGDAKRLAGELTEAGGGDDVLFAVGGDGTASEVLDGIAFHSQRSFGYIPAGTENCLARTLGLPADPLRALKRQLARGSRTVLGYGILTYGEQELLHRRFVNRVGLGYGAAVCHSAPKVRLRGLFDRLGVGRLSYFFAGIPLIVRTRPTKGYIVLDGVKRVEFNHILFVSCRLKPADGSISVCVFSHASRLKLIPFLLRAGAGGNRVTKGFRCYECREARIHTETALPLHADGEFCGCCGELQAGCIAGKLRMTL